MSIASVLRNSMLGLTVMTAGLSSAGAADAPKSGLEEALASAMESKRGIRVYVNGQAIGGAVTRMDPGVSIELRNQEFGRIIVRWDRIDGIALP